MSFAGLLAHHATTTRDHFLALHTTERAGLDVELQQYVVSQAQAAARLHGLNVPQGLLNYILATSNPTMSREQLAARAASIAEHYVENPPAINIHGASDREYQAWLRGVGIQQGWSEQQRDWMLGTGVGSGGDSESPGVIPASYSDINTHWNGLATTLSAANWRNTPFVGVHGLSPEIARELMGQNLTPAQIVSGARHVHRLGISSREDIGRASRLERDAPGFMDRMQDYRGTLLGLRRGERDLQTAETRAAALEAQGRTEEAAAARADIAERRRLLEERRKQAEDAEDRRIEALPEARRGDGGHIRRRTREAVGALSGAELDAVIDRPEARSSALHGAGLGLGQVDRQHAAEVATVVPVVTRTATADALDAADEPTPGAGQRQADQRPAPDASRQLAVNTQQPAPRIG